MNRNDRITRTRFLNPPAVVCSPRFTAIVAVFPSLGALGTNGTALIAPHALN